MIVDYELDRSVARIYLNRPHRLNAVVPELASGLVAAFGRPATTAPGWPCWPAAAGPSAPATT